MSKPFNIYEPIYDHIGEPNEASIIFLMMQGCTEKEAKEKIKNGWKYPQEDEEKDDSMKDQNKIVVIQTITIVIQIITLILQIAWLIILIIR